MIGGRRARCAAVGILLLTGCSGASGDLAGTTATPMQASVVAIADSVARHDLTGAVEQLDALQSRLDLAVANGQVGATRAAQIQAAIDRVRGDLATLDASSTPAPAASRSATSTSGSEHPGKSKSRDPKKP